VCINRFAFLACDMWQKANRGHHLASDGPLPLDGEYAAMADTLWDRSLKYNPRDPHWPDATGLFCRLATGALCSMHFSTLPGSICP